MALDFKKKKRKEKRKEKTKYAAGSTQSKTLTFQKIFVLFSLMIALQKW